MSDGRFDLSRHGLCVGSAHLQCARFERPLQAEALTWTCLDAQSTESPRRPHQLTGSIHAWKFLRQVQAPRSF